MENWKGSSFVLFLLVSSHSYSWSFVFLYKLQIQCYRFPCTPKIIVEFFIEVALSILIDLGFPGGKEYTCQRVRQERHGFNPWVGKIPWSRKWHTHHSRRLTSDNALLPARSPPHSSLEAPPGLTQAPGPSILFLLLHAACARPWNHLPFSR